MAGYLQTNMKKLLIILCMASVLAGCSVASYQRAQGRANEVKNGMTVAQAISIIGIPPTGQSKTSIEWQHSNEPQQLYNGTTSGSIRFELLDGRIVGIPEDGIFSGTAAKNARQMREARAAAEAEQRRADGEALMRDQEARAEITRQTSPAAPMSKETRMPKSATQE